MADVAGVKERVQAYLTSEGPVQIDDKGRFSILQGSVRVFVEVDPHPNGENTVVRIIAPFLFNVPVTPELYKFVALHADDWIFGSLGLWPDESGDEGLMVMRHQLLGEYLDKDELMSALIGIAVVADRLDDEMMAEFGGTRATDE